ncbi:MAG: SurA N-terminal domain-containing protein, partial [Anaerolineales bacterium]|nr:SurA N-terminal domain-containing protein [Anaerolineales bacterium]
MARKDGEDVERKKTPKELAKERRDRRLRRRVMAAVGGLALVIVGILAYGWYDVNVLSQRQPVATVSGETITQQEFKARVRLLQIQLANQLQRTQSMAAFFGSDAQAQQAIQQQVQQMQMQLSDPTLIGERAIDQLIQEVLVREEAEERGISVSEQEVDTEIQELFGYYEDGTPTPAPTFTPRPTRTID